MAFLEDLVVAEEHGRLAGAAPETVSHTAIQRGLKQPGSIGSGDHFCEVEGVDHVSEPESCCLPSPRVGQIVVQCPVDTRLWSPIAQDNINTAGSLNNRTLAFTWWIGDWHLTLAVERGESVSGSDGLWR